MSTQTQISANRANAHHSTGPKSDAGKNASARNHFTHGLTGAAFTILDWEDRNAFETLFSRLRLEHQPVTITEEILVEKMAQHFWLSQRATALQGMCFKPDLDPADQPKQLMLYTRYQTAPFTRASTNR